MCSLLALLRCCSRRPPPSHMYVPRLWPHILTLHLRENEISLKVIFANHDGVHSIIDISLDSTCGDLKKALLLEWPDVATLQPPPAEERIRLICMGRGMLQPPPSLLSTFGIAKFSTHPTPINCSIRPADVPIKPPPPAKALANALTNMVRSPPSNPLAPQAAAAPPAGEAGTVPYPNSEFVRYTCDESDAQAGQRDGRRYARRSAQLRRRKTRYSVEHEEWG